MKQEVRLSRPAEAFSKAHEISLRDCGERERTVLFHSGHTGRHRNYYNLNLALAFNGIALFKPKLKSFAHFY